MRNEWLWVWVKVSSWGSSVRVTVCQLSVLLFSIIGEEDLQHRKSRTPWSSRPTRHRTWGRKSRAWLLVVEVWDFENLWDMWCGLWLW